MEQVDYELTANAQIWPRHLNTMINGTKDGIYLVVGDVSPLFLDTLCYRNIFPAW